MRGQKIEDHSFWAGSKGKSSVAPDGVHVKLYSSSEGEGAVDSYEDTTEAIKSQQDKGKSKIKSHPMKEGCRY